MNLTKRFSTIRKKDVKSAGGKGASLGEMVNAGIRVPKGYVILSETFENFLNKEGIKKKIDLILSRVNKNNINSINSASKNISSLIINSKVDEELKKEILKEFDLLKCKYVAVRSSATSEDSKDAAWAGQLNTFLNVKEENLIESVKKCWASLYTPRAIFYRFENKLHKKNIFVAVVIQKMVNSKKAGVAFSVHPVSQDEKQILIEGGFGLGEAVVSGAITPDSYVVDKKSLELVTENINSQLKKLVRNEKGKLNKWVKIKEEGRKRVLNKKEIRELSKVILKIEKHYGFAVDVEWAFEKDKFYITQSRPITTLGSKEKLKNIRKDKQFINFEKSYSRDSTLFLQGLWAKSLVNLSKKNLGWKNPNLPIITHYVNDGVLEIWENKKAINWMYGQLLNLNSDLKFLKKIHKSYKSHIKSLEKIHKKGVISSKSDFKKYINLIYITSLELTLFFYTGMDERNSKKAKDLAVKAREKGDFFADNDLFIKKSIAKLGGISNQLAGVVLPEEVFNIPSKTILKKRLKNYILIDGDKSFLENLKKFSKKNPKYIFQKNLDKKSVSSFEGQIAFEGIIKGKVKIVKKQSDLKKVNKGDILVSPMTTPDFLPAMKKASSFITDEGGITCHASIVAREMKKPCIIGTKIATEVLKDGVNVEVNANEGFIRIIKKAKK